ncbi:alpha/beta hydrolase [Salinarchaeum sp. Harcht-Bsk1]|uniref:alpha/beta fold hydrolase n=1 Tax=Salinarchaeum sp. Harcht-Bsk1 TaxID=1333523 RepID=UPI0003422FBF|nr:alpha/beta fold hydrolase [Salinarchaeum sp. Harcht-Bsk1]AGN01891.1 alpha/beta hydrolase [Salinarchaeum sp. Harcht-Bsk1]
MHDGIDGAAATNRGVDVTYATAGEGEAVAFVPTLGYGAWQWGWQFPAVAGPFRAIAMELRGTGGSDAPPGPYDVATLAADLEAVLADAGVRRVHIVGFGLGGHVALEYAAQYDRARSLALIGTTPGLPEGDLPGRVRAEDGTDRDLVDALFAPAGNPDALRASLSPALSAAFRAEHPDVIEGIAEWRADEDADRAGWNAQAPAFTDWERSWPPYEMTEPTLVVQGGADRVVSPDNAAVLEELLPDAERVDYPDAGHLVTVERSRPLNDRLIGWLERHASIDRR